MTAELILSFAISLTVTVIMSFILIPALKRMKAEQAIQEDGPVWHMKKQGTPTMGGIIFIIGTVIAVLAIGFNEMRFGNYSHIYVLIFALIFALIGFLDDYEKIKKKQNLGLKAKQKFILQLIASGAFIFVMHFTGNMTLEIYVPFVNVTFSIPPILYYITAAFVVIGTVNAANLTDGVDGLATGVTIPMTASLAVVALLWNDSVNAIIAAAVTGGLFGFLIFNFYPAKVFMGDTGSMFLGGVVCALVFSMDIPLILLILGFIYIIVTLSVIIQVLYFKMTKGKRIFKMAPIHHHFEKSGWSEYKVFTVFTTISVIFAIIAYFGVYHRYQ